MGKLRTEAEKIKRKLNDGKINNNYKIYYYNNQDKIENCKKCLNNKKLKEFLSNYARKNICKNCAKEEIRDRRNHNPGNANLMYKKSFMKDAEKIKNAKENKKDGIINLYDRNGKKSYSEIIENFDLSTLKFSRVKNYEECRELFNNHHYAGFGRHPKIMYGAYINENIIAAIKYSNPIRKEVASSIGFEFEQVLELERFCIKPKFHIRNLASKFISASCRILKKEFPNIRVIVSFADPMYGHDGTIYKAANWKLSGTTAESYFYKDENGEETHKKTI